MQDSRPQATAVAAVGCDDVPVADDAALATELGQRCWQFLLPLLVQLDAVLDVRPVRTLAATVVALVRHRNRPLALLLSELGAFLAGPTHAPAGTKRLATLIHHRRWTATRIDDWLLAQGHAQVAQEAAQVPEGRALCILDGSVLEKPESMVAEGLAPVRSSKVRRWRRPRPKLGTGYWRGTPGGPSVVPGWQWVGVLVSSWTTLAARRPLTLGAWHWYTKPLPAPEGPVSGAAEEGPVSGAASPDGIPRQREREAQAQVLQRVTAAWGTDRLLHVWDRGLSGAGWLGECLDQGWHFVVRWKKGNHLRPADAPSVGDPAALPAHRERDGRAAWRLTAGLRPWGERQIANPRNPHQPLTVRFAARPVRLLHRDDPLWLVIVRLGKATPRRRGSGEPWRLLTTEPVTTAAECWRIVEAYVARWQIEQMLRFGKSELGVESIRVRAWEPRRKLLGLVSLAYAFLVAVLADLPGAVLTQVLRWAHRTGRKARDAAYPLYRLRAALAALWNHHTPTFAGLSP
jgi:hypothetical protein